MSLNEHMKPGIYLDESEQDIWRKDDQGNWTVNGKEWIPFPNSLTTLRTIIEVESSDTTKIDRDNVSTVRVSTRQEVDEIMLQMHKIVDTYGSITVSDLCDLIGIKASFADERLGWTDLSMVTVNRIRKGYVVNLPKPSPLRHDKSKAETEWRVIPEYPSYEASSDGCVRFLVSKREVNLCCAQPHHQYYLMVDDGGAKHWVPKKEIDDFSDRIGHGA